VVYIDSFREKKEYDYKNQRYSDDIRDIVVFPDDRIAVLYEDGVRLFDKRFPDNKPTRVIAIA
jgi:hypothetical protein